MAGHSGGKLEYLESVNARNLYLLFRGLFSPGQIVELVPGSEPYEIREIYRQRSRDDDLLRSAMRLEFGSYLQHQLLRDTDVMSMTHSLEARVPFLGPRTRRSCVSTAASRQVFAPRQQTALDARSR